VDTYGRKGAHRARRVPRVVLIEGACVLVLRPVQERPVLVRRRRSWGCVGVLGHAEIVRAAAPVRIMGAGNETFVQEGRAGGTRRVAPADVHGVVRRTD